MFSDKSIKYSFLFFLQCLFICYESKSQTSMNIDSLNASTINDEECAYYKDSVPKKNKHPFNRTDHVELISFSSKPDGYDSLIINRKLVVGNIKQRKKLPLQELDSLHNMLYNYRSKLSIMRNGVFLMQGSCYDPHHAIIFYQGSEAIGYLEICFKCYALVADDHFEFFGSCQEKFNYIRNLFTRYKLTYKLKE